MSLVRNSGDSEEGTPAPSTIGFLKAGHTGIRSADIDHSLTTVSMSHYLEPNMECTSLVMLLNWHPNHPCGKKLSTSWSKRIVSVLAGRSHAPITQRP